MNLSEIITAFLNACDACTKDHAYYYEVVGNCDKATTDFLHTIELDKLSYTERAKLTTVEKANLRKRRKAKNAVELNEPLIKYLELPESQRALNLLRQTLGEIRKVEKYHASRTYTKRSWTNESHG